ncbi:MAG: hypothetical protein J7L94_11285 [Caldisericaceae bacterium]|nr:hypothetical protein [Caldisericaceae bacterium]
MLTAAKPATYQLVIHPEFNVHTNMHDEQQLGAYVWFNNQWKRYNRDLWQNNGPDTKLLLDAAAGGKHAFFNHQQNFRLIETYDPEKVEKLRTWWVPEQKQLNLEIETKPVVLKKGQKWEFNYQLHFWEKFE